MPERETPKVETTKDPWVDNLRIVSPESESLIPPYYGHQSHYTGILYFIEQL